MTDTDRHAEPPADHGADRPPEAPPGPIPVRQARLEPGTARTEGPAQTGGPAESAAQLQAGAAHRERTFTADAQEWIARIAGESAAGAAGGGRAYLVAVQFFRRGQDQPEREALLPRGRFEMLFEDELAELLRKARKLEDAPPRGD